MTMEFPLAEKIAVIADPETHFHDIIAMLELGNYFGIFCRTSNDQNVEFVIELAEVRKAASDGEISEELLQRFEKEYEEKSS